MKRTVMLFAAATLVLGICAWVTADELATNNWIYIRGDANIDGQVDIADMIDSLGYVFGVVGHREPHCLAAHDANDDNLVDVADPIYTANYLFAGGPPPPAPFPFCGFDRTEPVGGWLPCNDFYVCDPRPPAR